MWFSFPPLLVRVLCFLHRGLVWTWIDQTHVLSSYLVTALFVFGNYLDNRLKVIMTVLSVYVAIVSFRLTSLYITENFSIIHDYAGRYSDLSLCSCSFLTILHLELYLVRCFVVIRYDEIPILHVFIRFSCIIISIWMYRFMNLMFYYNALDHMRQVSTVADQ